MITLVNYSDDTMTTSQRVCSESALANGVDRVWSHNPNTIAEEFKLLNQDIFKEGSRGAGCYWLFKPYIIYKAITQPSTSEGDIIIYSDAGVKWISNVNEIISRMDQDIFLFSNGHQHVHWCKKDVMIAMFDSDSLEAYEAMASQQCQASVIFFKVNQNTKNFIKEWLLYCMMPGFIDDSPSKESNHPEFAEHRHDQAILTCLAIKYGYKLHWWADKLWYESQRYRWADDKYPSMFEHHRKRDPGKGGGKDPEW